MASFIIDIDHIGDGDCNGKMFGNEEYLQSGKAKHKFKLFDDDGELYYEGRCGNSSSFDPLDWAMANDGCTDIQYFENGKWSSL